MKDHGVVMYAYIGNPTENNDHLGALTYCTLISLVLLVLNSLDISTKLQ